MSTICLQHLLFLRLLHGEHLPIFLTFLTMGILFRSLCLNSCPRFGFRRNARIGFCWNVGAISGLMERMCQLLSIAFFEVWKVYIYIHIYGVSQRKYCWSYKKTITSMVHKIETIMAHILDRDSDVIFLTESWLKSDQNHATALVKSWYKLLHNRIKYRKRVWNVNTWYLKHTRHLIVLWQ